MVRQALTQFRARVRDAIGWRARRLRRGWAILRARWKAGSVLRELARLKRANPGRPFCGILLIEHIGDIIACEPVIERVRARTPSAFVVWMVRREYAPLLSSHPDLDAVVFVDSLLVVERIIESRILDVVVDLHVNSKPTEAPDRFYQKKSGDPSVDAKSYLEKGSLFRAFSLGAGIEAPASQSFAPKMFISAETVRAIDALSLPAHFVVVHATANYGDRDWAASKWRDLVRYIVDRHETRVFEIGLKTVIDLDHPRFASLCGCLSIIETAELIRRCAFYIGVVSGPAHMANAWRRPALILFGRFLGSDTFNPFDGYYADEEATVILRYPGRLPDQPVATVISAFEASPLWKRAGTL